ncbi:hypothetical protein PR048_004429 [Dryococelus australis]|uniref:Uncharacterized protein n=1 Tax=Dryococelus australis TaxID=614101 RepID=A0ABQ9I5E3_9NEOP|nr:hypothetical protein PR048_004429 [Dryococelus australis]
MRVIEKICRPAASSGMIPTCENPAVIQPGIEPGSPWWEASRLTAQGGGKREPRGERGQGGRDIKEEMSQGGKRDQGGKEPGGKRDQGGKEPGGRELKEESDKGGGGELEEESGQGGKELKEENGQGGEERPRRKVGKGGRKIKEESTRGERYQGGKKGERECRGRIENGVIGGRSWWVGGSESERTRANIGKTCPRIHERIKENAFHPRWCNILPTAGKRSTHVLKRGRQKSITLPCGAHVGPKWGGCVPLWSPASMDELNVDVYCCTKHRREFTCPLTGPLSVRATALASLGVSGFKQSCTTLLVCGFNTMPESYDDDTTHSTRTGVEAETPPPGQHPSRGKVGFTRRFHTLSSIHATKTSLAVAPQSPVVHTCLRSRTLSQTASVKDCGPLGCGTSLTRTFLRRSLNVSEILAGEERSVTPASLAAVGIHGIPKRGSQEAAGASFQVEGRTMWVSDYDAGQLSRRQLQHAHDTTCGSVEIVRELEDLVLRNSGPISPHIYYLQCSLNREGRGTCARSLPLSDAVLSKDILHIVTCSMLRPARTRERTGQRRYMIATRDLDRRLATGEVTSGREVSDCEYQAVKDATGRLDYWTRCTTTARRAVPATETQAGLWELSRQHVWRLQYTIFRILPMAREPALRHGLWPAMIHEELLPLAGLIPYIIWSKISRKCGSYSQCLQGNSTNWKRLDYCVRKWMKATVYQRTTQTREEQLLARIMHAAAEITDSPVQLHRAEQHSTCAAVEASVLRSPKKRASELAIPTTTVLSRMTKDLGLKSLRPTTTVNELSDTDMNKLHLACARLLEVFSPLRQRLIIGIPYDRNRKAQVRLQHHTAGVTAVERKHRRTTLSDKELKVRRGSDRTAVVSQSERPADYGPSPALCTHYLRQRTCLRREPLHWPTPPPPPPAGETDDPAQRRIWRNFWVLAYNPINTAAVQRPAVFGGGHLAECGLRSHERITVDEEFVVWMDERA